ncbi:hypothetical protein UFOVP668_24 [uncultured Caudovirales phage]|uniref:Uncharacterized protein n=1 Tax=uncultured Caudovirales phage TaxID=2100421 RepID=A0A6J5NAG6_9CAUD|nr:hypothetical protein UFOVP668_24 [uncultured Caudovirales phage]
MAETLSSTIQSILDSFKLGNVDFVKEVVDAITNERVDQNSSTFLDDVGILLSESKYLKERFSANETRKKNNLPPLPLTQILELENSYTTVLQAAGFPPGFYDDPATDFQGFIARNTSPAEINRRVNEGYAAVKNADPEVIKQFKELYGITEGELAAYFLDPTRQEASITKSMESAQIAAEGRRAAGIQLGVGQAEELQQAGVTSATARQGFANIAAQQELFNPLQGEQAISQAEQVGGTFGTNTAAAQRIAQRKRQRSAEFEAGGGFARTNQFATEGLRTVGQ